MSRCKDAPIGFECPYRHNCPHLEGLSTTWVMEAYQECFELRQQLHRLEIESQQRIDELQKTLLERDATIAQLRLQHQKQFKANVKAKAAPIKVESPPARRAGGASGLESTRAGPYRSGRARPRSAGLSSLPARSVDPLLSGARARAGEGAAHPA